MVKVCKISKDTFLSNKTQGIKKKNIKMRIICIGKYLNRFKGNFDQITPKFWFGLNCDFEI